MNKPRCYPQQRLGNYASKEKIWAHFFFQFLGKYVDVLKHSLLLRQNYKGRRLGNLVRNLNFPKPFQNVNQNLRNWPDTAPNILHNLDGQHEATYAQDCTYHLSLPRLILELVLVLVLLLLVHQRNRPGLPVPNQIVFSTFLPWTPPEPTRNLLGTLPWTCPEPEPPSSRTPFRKQCPGTCPEPPWNIARNLPRTLSRNLPRNLPGTRGSEAAPAPPRNLNWRRPHS